MNHDEYTAKLNPCPFCGGKAGESVFFTGFITPGNYGVKCISCALEMKHDRIDKVIGIWNTRSDLERLREENERLKTELKENLPEDCVDGWGEVKFCSFRNGEGNKCKHCAD